MDSQQPAINPVIQRPLTPPARKDPRPPKTKHLRVSKACNSCQVRKLKCQSAHPCQNCLDRSITCEFREKARHRPSKHGRASGASAIRRDDSDAESSRSASPVAARGRQKEKTGSVIGLYYGTSSASSFLNNINRESDGKILQQGAQQGPPPNYSGTAGPSLNDYNLQRLYLSAQSNQHAYPPANELQSFCSMVHLDCASGYLKSFMSSFHHLAPFVSTLSLQKLLKQMYGNPQIFAVQRCNKAVLLLVLTLGATMARDDNTSFFLQTQAKQSVVALADVINLQAVQASVLMISGS